MESSKNNERATRRQLFTRVAMAGSVVTLANTLVPSISGSTGVMAAAAQGTPERTEEVGRVSGIAWSFAVLGFYDDYDPDRLQPPTRQPDVRYAAALVEIENDSDQGLNFSPGNVRLRDTDGTEYAAGTVFGEEPRLNGRNLNEGERARGWVWFALAEDAEPIEVVFSAPNPQFLVALTSDSAG